MENISVQHRKSLGVYYTPDNLSEILCGWSIRSANEIVLEPSFGGCGFLEASVNKLASLGAKNPKQNLYGVDLDKRAFDFLSQKIGSPSQVKKRFVLHDFISVSRDTFDVNYFDVVLGNPPYVSTHNMTVAQRNNCQATLKDNSFVDGSLGTNTNLWAFFLVKATSFLKEGGRMAWVLPSSALYASYAKKLFEQLEKHFSKFNLIQLNERLFRSSGAEELSVIVLAEDFRKTPQNNSRKYHVVKGVSELNQYISNADWDKHGFDNFKDCIISPLTRNNFFNLRKSPHVIRLGDISDIKIGLVTGANKWFTLSENRARELKLHHSHLKPIITKFNQLKGLTHSLTAHRELRKSNSDTPTLLLNPSQINKPSASARYLAKISKNDRENNRTFKKRPQWFRPDDGLSPDAFLSYMFDTCPKLVLNEDCEVNCTNSIHRVYFKTEMSVAYKRAVSLSFLSSFSKLSAEYEGKSYGSGVQKLEPTAAKNVRLFINEKLIIKLNRVWDKVNKLLIENNENAATELIDNIISTSQIIDANELKEMNVAANELRRNRYEIKLKE